MDRMIALPATAAPFLPVAETPLQDLPLFVAVGTDLDTLRVSGPDAVKFLQGQVTCDVSEIGAGGLRLGAHCTPKGRAQASFLAFADTATDGMPAIHLLLPPGMAAPTRQQLGKYAQFSKVTLHEVETGLGPLPMIMVGTQASAVLARLGLIAPPAMGQLTVLFMGELRVPLHVTALDAAQSLFCLIAPAGSLSTLLAVLPDNAHVSGQNGWWQCMSWLGQPHVFPATQEQFIPQELNYDLNGGISFKKGCYKGQEIIARLHFKGTPKFRTLRFEWRSALPPVIGSTVSDDNGQTLGHIALAAQNGADIHEVLLVVKPGDLRLDQPLLTEQGVAVELRRLPLPYVTHEAKPTPSPMPE